jgi:hypothetical protein
MVSRTIDEGNILLHGRLKQLDSVADKVWIGDGDGFCMIPEASDLNKSIMEYLISVVLKQRGWDEARAIVNPFVRPGKRKRESKTNTVHFFVFFYFKKRKY